MKRALIIASLFMAAATALAQKLTIDKTTIDVGKTGF